MHRDGQCLQKPRNKLLVLHGFYAEISIFVLFSLLTLLLSSNPTFSLFHTHTLFFKSYLKVGNFKCIDQDPRTWKNID